MPSRSIPFLRPYCQAPIGSPIQRPVNLGGAGLIGIHDIDAVVGSRDTPVLFFSHWSRSAAFPGGTDAGFRHEMGICELRTDDACAAAQAFISADALSRASFQPPIKQACQWRKFYTRAASNSVAVRCCTGMSRKGSAFSLSSHNLRHFVPTILGSGGRDE